MPRLLLAFILLSHLQTTYAQPASLHDSLRHLLAFFQDSTKDEKLKLAIKEAQALHPRDFIDDSLARKLLNIEDLLAHIYQRKLILPYQETLMRLFQQLPPQGEHLDYAYSLDYLGGSYHAIGQFEKALPLYQQALEIKRKVLGEEHPNCATSLDNLARLFSHRAEYDKALPLYHQALAIKKKAFGEGHYEYINILQHLADLYFYNFGLCDSALLLYEKVASFRKKEYKEESTYYASSLNDLANVFNRKGEYHRAMPLCEKALAIQKKILSEEDPDYINSLNNLVTINYGIGQYKKAVAISYQVVAIEKKILNQENTPYNKKLYAISLNNLGLLLQGLKQYDTALYLHKQVLTIIKNTSGENTLDYAISLNNLALLYQNLGQYDTAILLCKQAFEITKKAAKEEDPIYALSLYKLANLHRIVGQYDTALLLSQESMNIAKKSLGEEHLQYTYLLNNLGLLYSTLGKIIQASDLLIKSNYITLNHLNCTYSVLSEAEKTIFLNKEVFQFSYLPSLVFTQKTGQSYMLQQLYANELALKGMVLQDQQGVLNAIRKNKDSMTLRLYEQWRLKKAFIGKQLLLPIKQQIPYFDSLEGVANQLEQQLSRQSTSFRTQLQSQHLTAQDITQKLSRGQAAVEFIRFSLYNKKQTDSILYAALVLLPQDSALRFVPLFEEKQLDRLLQPSSGSTTAYPNIKKLYAHEQEKGLGDSLYNLVWKPLEQYLTGIHTIFYAPTGLLHRISFQALPTAAHELLIDKYQLNQVLSTRSVAFPVKMSPKPATAAVWGNIEYNLASGKNNSTVALSAISRSQNEMDTALSSFTLYNEDTRGLRGTAWKPLKFAKEEMDSVQWVFRKAGITIRAFSNTTASEEAFKTLDGKSPQVLHLITHGFFLPVQESKPRDNEGSTNTFTVQQNPLFRSGLVLAGGNRVWKDEPALPGREDGILTAYEIAQMDLSNTELVVLSACETALGDLLGNEGVLGLQRAFKMAGVKQMIVTLWQVPDDKTTIELMTLFYKYWLGGQTTREALRNAQLKMKEKYKEPYYWAAFMLVE